MTALIWISDLKLVDILFQTILIGLLSAYPSLMLYSLLDAEYEEAMFLESYWMVYIFGAVHTGLLVFNHDIGLGTAARKLKVNSDGFVDAIIWCNTTISILTVLTYSTFSAFAEQDYLKWTIEGSDPAPVYDEDQIITF